MRHGMKNALSKLLVSIMQWGLAASRGGTVRTLDRRARRALSRRKRLNRQRLERAA